MQKLIDRYSELCRLSDNNSDYLIELDCLMHLFESRNRKVYHIISDICLRKNYNCVVDIGCAFAHQSEIFLNNSIKYIGINDVKWGEIFNQDKIIYVQESYPCKLPEIDKSKTLCVSIMCLTWNCYLYEDDTLQKQIDALQKDFNQIILTMPIDRVNRVGEYFKQIDIIDKDQLSCTVLFTQ